MRPLAEGKAIIEGVETARGLTPQMRDMTATGEFMGPTSHRADNWDLTSPAKPEIEAQEKLKQRKDAQQARHVVPVFLL